MGIDFYVKENCKEAFMKIIKKNITPKKLCSALVMGSLMTFLWLFAGFTVKYSVYNKQSNTSNVQVFDWGIIEMDRENFVVCADFRFHTGGMQEHTSQHLFENTSYLSEDGAKAAIEEMKAKEWKCYWYGSAKDPIVSLTRNFPLKQMVYTLISFGIFVYFSILKKRYFLKLS